MVDITIKREFIKLLGRVCEKKFIDDMVGINGLLKAIEQGFVGSHPSPSPQYQGLNSILEVGDEKTIYKK